MNPPSKKCVLPSGKLTVCYDKSPFFIGKSTVNDHFQYLCAYVFLKITRGFTILHHHQQCWGSPFPSPAAIGAPPHMPRWLHCRPWRFLLASEILWHWTSLQIFHGVFLGRWYNIYIYILDIHGIVIGYFLDVYEIFMGIVVRYLEDGWGWTQIDRSDR